MSHVTTIKTEISNLESFKMACHRLDLTVEKISENQYLLAVPGSRRLVTATCQSDGNYTLATDYWGADGKAIIDHCGNNFGKLKQLYSLEESRTWAIKNGYSMYEEQAEDEVIRLTIEV